MRSVLRAGVCFVLVDAVELSDTVALVQTDLILSRRQVPAGVVAANIDAFGDVPKVRLPIELIQTESTRVAMHASNGTVQVEHHEPLRPSGDWWETWYVKWSYDRYLASEVPVVHHSVKGRVYEECAFAYVALFLAAFCIGTSYIFLKMEFVKKDNLSTHVIAVWYSVGYMFAGMCVAFFLTAVGKPVELSYWGMLGGVIYACAKYCTYVAVRSEIGVALTVGIAAVVAIFMVFVEGIFLGEAVTSRDIVGILILTIGLLLILGSRSQIVGEWLRLPKSEMHVEEYHGGYGTPIMSTKKGVFFAACAGILLGLSVLPVPFSETSSSTYAIGLAIGQFSFISLTAGTMTAYDASQGRLHLGLRSGFPAGMIGGSLLFTASALIAFGAKRLGVVATILKNTSMIWAGIWGIVLFDEIRGWRLIMMFFVGSAVSLFGALVLVLD